MLEARYLRRALTGGIGLIRCRQAGSAAGFASSSRLAHHGGLHWAGWISPPSAFHVGVETCRRAVKDDFTGCVETERYYRRVF